MKENHIVKIADAAIAVGACSAVAQRLGLLEKALLGHDPASGFAGVVKPVHLAGLSPISDVRASADYRSRSAAELVERALAACAAGGAE